MAKKQPPGDAEPAGPPVDPDWEAFKNTDEYLDQLEEAALLHHATSGKRWDLSVLGARLVESRKAKGWDQRMLALWTGIPGPTISKFENGHRRPNLENVVKLADALGVSVDYLAGRTLSKLAHVTAPPEIPIPSAFTRSHALMLIDLLKDGLRKSKDIAYEDEPERPPPFELPPDLEIPDPDDELMREGPGHGGPPWNVLGLDFTSRPRRSKPITCLHCEFDGEILRADRLEELPDFDAFDEVLRRPGPWIAGLDFPFGQSRRFIENIGWPQGWEGYVLHAESLGREGFREALTAYKETRPKGDKEHRRQTDIEAGAISPQKLHGVPVGLMFFEGAHRLIHADVTIPHVRAGDPDRIVVEAYPGALARNLIGKRSYKNDIKNKQTADQCDARREIFEAVTSEAIEERIGFRVEAAASLADDPTGDELDALLCAVQAAWAWQNRDNRYGVAGEVDALEGWIVGPVISNSA